MDRRTIRHRQIDPRMHARIPKNRVEPQSIGRGYVEIADRHHQPGRNARGGKAAQINKLPTVAPAHQLRAGTPSMFQPGIDQIADLAGAICGAFVTEDHVISVARRNAVQAEMRVDGLKITLDRRHRRASRPRRQVNTAAHLPSDAQGGGVNGDLVPAERESGTGTVQPHGKVKPGAQGEVFQWARGVGRRARAQRDIHPRSRRDFAQRLCAIDEVGGARGIACANACTLQHTPKAVAGRKGCHQIDTRAFGDGCDRHHHRQRPHTAARVCPQRQRGNGNLAHLFARGRVQPHRGGRLQG